MAKKKRAILYARSATDDGNTINRQLVEGRAWARVNGYIVTGEYFEVASGLTWHLPEQAKAIAQAAGNGTVLICTGPDRLSREAGRLADIMVTCARLGVAVCFMEG